MIKKTKKISLVQKIVLAIIVICSILVVTATVIVITNKPENVVKRTITELSEDYYENYLYAKFSKTIRFKTNPAKMMELYEKHGFSNITLRQLLLYKNENSKYAEFLKDYCDENQTLIKFYPEAPYEAKNYHINYTYSCDF